MQKYLVILLVLILTGCGLGNIGNKLISQPSDIVIVGAHGTIVGSVDGNVWVAIPSVTINDLHAIAYFNPGAYDASENYFVAVGDNGTIAYNYLNNSAWHLAAWSNINNLNFLTLCNWINGISSKNILIGGSSNNYAEGEVLLGDNLTINQYAYQAFGNGTVRSMASNISGEVVGVGNNGMIIDTNVDHEGEFYYNTPASTTNNLNGVATYNSNFIAVGDNGTILFNNEESYTFTVESSPTINNLKAISCVSNLCIAVGDAGMILSSNDGQTWAQESSPTVVGLNAITYWNANYWIVGNNGIILKSSTGKNWQYVNSGTNQNLFGVAGD